MTKNITITCNGEQRTIEPQATLEDLALSLQMNPRSLVAELNGRIVEHVNFTDHILDNGDRVELIRFVGGG